MLLSLLAVGPLVTLAPARAQDSAQDPWGMCPRPTQPALPPAPADATTRFSADHLESSPEGVYVLRGNVQGSTAGQRLEADRVTYDDKNREATASGHVLYQSDTLLVNADQGELQLDRDQGRLAGVDYRLLRGHGRGEAEEAERLDATHSRLHQVTYTTCPPGNVDWQLKAKRVDLDHEDGSGTAHDAVLRFKGIPVAWLPWASFPLDDRRKSGVLVPTVSSAGNGLDVRVPYYFNLAPNYDATLTPRVISNRGLMMGGEFRYLLPQHEGRLRFEYMPHDQLAGEDRGLFQYNNASHLSEHWRFDVGLNRATDANYFEDFGDSLDVSATAYLRSALALTGEGTWWTAALEADDYQVLADFADPTRKPYQRVPRMWVDARQQVGNTPVYWSLGSELVNFQRDAGATGTRFDVFPSVGARLNNSYGYVEPRLGVRYTGYTLDGAPGSTNPSRSLPVASLDAGLVFERFLDGGKVQTLEPRFYYLYIPYDNQDTLPVFDTTNFDFEFGQLFRENRFSGPDRIGDANQVTLAVTSRLLDPATGRNPLTVSVGQIAYFRDREVQLPGQPVETASTSPLITEVEYSPLDAWSAVLGLHLDLQDSQSDKTVLGLRYHPGGGKLFNFSYRFRRDLLKVADVSAVWPFARDWRLLARWYYDLDANRTLEALAGVEYESCCWALRLVTRHYVHNRQGETRDGIYLQLVLKGLGTLGGGRAEDVVERGILGYEEYGASAMDY